MNEARIKTMSYAENLQMNLLMVERDSFPHFRTIMSGVLVKLEPYQEKKYQNSELW
jgi:hypothetical protein